MLGNRKGRAVQGAVHVAERIYMSWADGVKAEADMRHILAASVQRKVGLGRMRRARTFT